MPSYVITGVSRGIGFEFVRQLSAKADSVVFGLVRDKNTSTRVLEFAKGTSNVHILQADVTDFKALQEAAAEVARITGGSLDVLINNAVYIDMEHKNYTLDMYSEESLVPDLNKSMEVNVLGVIRTINVFLPLIRKGSVKKVLTLSSAQGDLDFARNFEVADFGPYSVSKAAVNMVMVKYAVRFKDEGVVFLTISPGWVNTLQGPLPPEAQKEITALMERMRKFYPDWNGKPLEPEESVSLQMQVLEKATIEDSGTFVSQYGNKQWV